MRDRLKKIRKALNLSQEDFGAKLGLTQTTISTMENGKSVLTVKNVKLICSTFNVNERWFKTGRGGMFLASANEKEFQELFSSLTPDTQKSLLVIARELLSVQEKAWNEENDC